MKKNIATTLKWNKLKSHFLAQKSLDLARFKTNVNAVELAGGAHLFFSPELAGADETITEEEKESEIDRSKAILLLKCADDVRYGGLSDKI